MSDFEAELNKQFEVVKANPTVFTSIWKLAELFLQQVQEAMKNSDLSKVSKTEFLKLVGDAYDKYILPLDLPGPDSILDPLLESLILSQASKLYDKFVPKQA